MKKLLSAALLICLSLFLLTGCSKTEDPYVGFKNVLNDMKNVREYEFKSNAEVVLPNAADNEITASMGEVLGEKFNIEIEGTQSYKQKQAKGTVKLVTPDQTWEITDFIIDGNTVYLNGQTMYNMILSVSGQTDTEGAVEELLNGKTYMEYEVEAGMDLWSESTNSLFKDNEGLEKMETNFSEVVDKQLSAEGAVKADGDTYTVDLDSKKLGTLATGILEDVEKNFDAYYDTLVELMTSVADSETDMSVFTDSKAELKTYVLGMISQAKTSLSEDGLAGLSYNQSVSFDKSKKTYESKITVIQSDVFEVRLNSTVTEADIEKTEVPTDTMPMEEFVEKTGLEDLSGGDISGDITGLTSDLDISEVVSATNFSVLNADLSGYEYLTAHTLTSSSGETEYDVPILNTDDVASYGSSVYSYGENVQMSYDSYYVGAYYDTASAFVQWSVEYAYEYLADVMQNPTNTDLLVSEDGNCALIALSYESGTFGGMTMIYAAFSLEGEDEIASMTLTIYSDEVEGADAGAISELSQIMGVDLTQYY